MSRTRWRSPGRCASRFSPRAELAASRTSRRWRRSPTRASRASSSAARSTPAPSRCRTRCAPPRAWPSMFAKRIIPCLDCKDGRVVKGVRFVDLRDAGDPGDLAEAYNREGADELVMLDISASLEGRTTLMNTVSQVARKLFVPLTVGGGVRSLDDARLLLSAGADKIAVNTAAVETPELGGEPAAGFRSQAVGVAIDARRIRHSKLGGRNSRGETGSSTIAAA